MIKMAPKNKKRPVKMSKKESESEKVSQSISESESESESDNESENEDNEWCMKCKKLISNPTHQSYAHFHMKHFDMFMCKKCFPIKSSDNHSCKCAIHCVICDTDTLYDCETCLPFSNTSRGYCEKCAGTLKSLILKKDVKTDA
jgi:hypothetical protein